MWRLVHGVDLDSMFSAMPTSVAMYDDGDFLSAFGSPSYSEKNFREFKCLLWCHMKSYG
jgi:hypothetical protein